MAKVGVWGVGCMRYWEKRQGEKQGLEWGVVGGKTKNSLGVHYLKHECVFDFSFSSFGCLLLAVDIVQTTRASRVSSKHRNSTNAPSSTPLILFMAVLVGLVSSQICAFMRRMSNMQHIASTGSH